MYNDLGAIDTALGGNIGGICSFKFVPKEWLTGPVIFNKVTGTVMTAPTLLAGKAWLTAVCMERSMEYTEKAKVEKAGAFVEATLSGVAYRSDLARHLVITTLHYHELVVIYKDSNGNMRIIGDRNKAMSFAADNTTGKDPKDASMYLISLIHQLPEAAPIYTGP